MLSCLLSQLLRKIKNHFYYNVFSEKWYWLAKNSDKFFYSIILLRFSKTKVAKEEFHGAKKPIEIWNVAVSNILTSRLNEMKINSH